VRENEIAISFTVAIAGQQNIRQRAVDIFRTPSQIDRLLVRQRCGRPARRTRLCCSETEPVPDNLRWCRSISQSWEREDKLKQICGYGIQIRDLISRQRLPGWSGGSVSGKVVGRADTTHIAATLAVVGN